MPAKDGQNTGHLQLHSEDGVETAHINYTTRTTCEAGCRER
jgi:hypothetical protein